jgi:hypothetical protein
MERRKYFDSLGYREQQELIKSFFNDRWDQYIAKNFLDRALDYINISYNLNLIDMRIKVLQDHKIFIVEKRKWDNIVKLIETFSDYYDPNIALGNLSVSVWGRTGQFYKISHLEEK